MWILTRVAAYGFRNFRARERAPRTAEAFKGTRWSPGGIERISRSIVRFTPPPPPWKTTADADSSAVVAKNRLAVLRSSTSPNPLEQLAGTTERHSLDDVRIVERKEPQGNPLGGGGGGGCLSDEAFHSIATSNSVIKSGRRHRGSLCSPHLKSLSLMPNVSSLNLFFLFLLGITHIFLNGF